MDYELFWAKARPDAGDGAAFHPLAAHSLDVAAVAVLLGVPKIPGLDARAVGFLVALHDIGKISRPFQAKVERLWPADALGPFPATRPPPGPPHDAMGLHLLSDDVAGVLDSMLPDWGHRHRIRLWRAVAGHHGRPPEEISSPLATVLCDGCRRAANGFVAAMFEVFRSPSLPRPAAPHDIDRLAWHLAGLTTLADWIGSRRAWFPYAAVEAVADPAAYFWNRAMPQALSAILAAGLAPAAPAPFAGVRGLFPRIELPSPVQVWAESVFPAGAGMIRQRGRVTGAGTTRRRCGQPAIVSTPSFHATQALR